MKISCRIKTYLTGDIRIHPLELTSAKLALERGAGSGDSAGRANVGRRDDIADHTVQVGRHDFGPGIVCRDASGVTLGGVAFDIARG